MKKKNGFTLIELLAVIVILAVIALIAVPQILKVLNNARKSAAEDSVYGVAEAAETYVADLMLANSGNYPNQVLEFSCDGTKCELTTATKTALTTAGATYKNTLEIKGKIPTSGTVTISSNGQTITGTTLVVNGYTCSYQNGKADCSGNSSGSELSTLQIGDEINYKTSLNGVQLENWKVFYIDGDYTYLILSDYLSGSAIDIDELETSGSAVYMEFNEEYMDDYSEGTRFYNKLMNRANWNSLLSGTLNDEIFIDETDNPDALAIGSPYLELWTNSWNESYPDDELYISKVASEEFENLDVYYIGTQENPELDYSKYVSFSETTGSSNELYFPYSTYHNQAEAYWVLSQSDWDDLYYVSFDLISTNCAGSTCVGGALRPVIKIPSSLLT